MKALTLVLIIGLGCVSQVQAHLLNMTKAQVSISDHGLVELHIQLDLTKASGGSAQYYELSQLSTPLLHPRLSHVWQGLVSAIELKLNDTHLAWQLVGVKLPSESEEEFNSGLTWPMTTLVMRAQLPDNFQHHRLSVTFQGSFKFEEPIALTVDYQGTGSRMSRWLVRNQQSPQFYFTEKPPERTLFSERIKSWGTYVWQGILHIVPNGWDHALFVLGLLLGAATFKQLTVLITAFTLAHSITLILVTFGAILSPVAYVELLIACSIVWVAAENILFKSHTWRRYLLVTVFGLLHGMGFAQALKALGLPTTGYIEALVSFNVGIEIAQLGIVALGWVGLKYSHSRLSTTKQRQANIITCGSVVIALVATFWVVERLWAL